MNDHKVALVTAGGSGMGAEAAKAAALKEAVADLTLENRLLKKSMIADGGDEE